MTEASLRSGAKKHLLIMVGAYIVILLAAFTQLPVRLMPRRPVDRGEPLELQRTEAGVHFVEVEGGTIYCKTHKYSPDLWFEPSKEDGDD